MQRIKRRTALIGAAVLTLAVATPAAALLTDIGGHWAAPLIGALEARGIISGDQYFRFNPEAPLTRAQLAKLLVTGLGSEADAHLLATYPSRFSDVPKWHWANGFVESLAEAGAVQGYPDGAFGPEDTVTRAQLAVIFVREAGLADQARLRQFELTGYADDAAVPDWARGAVQVAQKVGLMGGFEDNSFRPLQAVTRAEGSVALARLLSLKGRAFDLSGTLVKFDQVARTAVVRDFYGQERSVTMSLNAQYFRAGSSSYVGAIRPLDQVWIVLGPDGTGTFMDARYQDLLGKNLQVSGSTVTVSGADGRAQSATLQPGAPVYLNGRPVSTAQVDKATDAYLLFDQVSGDIRVLDAVNVTASGSLVGVDQEKHMIVIQNATGVQIIPLAPDAIYVLNGQRLAVGDLRIDDRLQLAQNASGQAEYVMAER